MKKRNKYFLGSAMYLMRHGAVMRDNREQYELWRYRNGEYQYLSNWHGLDKLGNDDWYWSDSGWIGDVDERKLFYVLYPNSMFMVVRQGECPV